MTSGVRTEASDSALVRRAAMGDRDAYSDLFERHSTATFRYALHMLDTDEQAAQDAVQEAWIKAWTHLKDFRGESSFLTWMFRITAREVYSARRRRRPVPVDDEQLRAHLTTATATAAGAQADDPGESGSELAEALSLELMGLPWRQRAVWLLRELEGLSYADIAAVLETTETTVRGQLHRARRTLAIRMEHWR